MSVPSVKDEMGEAPKRINASEQIERSVSPVAIVILHVENWAGFPALVREY
jgi:hypothetical protein